MGHVRHELGFVLRAESELGRFLFEIPTGAFNVAAALFHLLVAPRELLRLLFEFFIARGQFLLLHAQLFFLLLGGTQQLFDLSQRTGRGQCRRNAFTRTF